MGFIDNKSIIGYNFGIVKQLPLHNSNLKSGVMAVAKNLAISELLDIYAPVLTEKQRDVIELYYNEDLSLAEIAEHCGITRQGVRDSIKRGESVMIELEERLGFAKKMQSLVRAAEQIRHSTRDILLINDRVAYSAEIKRLAELILSNINTIDE